MPIFSKNRNKDEPQETHSFDDIVKGFQYAVNSAQEMLATQQPQTEGLSKLMDVMASCIEPMTVE